MITDDIKINILKESIQSSNGWKALAQSLQNKPESKKECIRLLHIIAGDKEVDMPVLGEPNEDGLYSDSSSNTVQTIKVKLAELLVQQLEHNIEKLNTKSNDIIGVEEK